MRNCFTLIVVCLLHIVSYAQSDAKVEAVYTLGKIPAPLGVYNHIVQARVINNGPVDLTDLPVFVNVTGANTFIDSQTVSISVGDAVVVNFDAFSPWIPGNNMVTVSVPADANSTNNSSVYTQIVNSNTFSYANASLPSGQQGFDNGEGILSTRYMVSGSTVVKQVKVHISNQAPNIGKTIYGVVLDGSTIISLSAPHIISASELNTYISLDIINPPSISNEFYAGILQTSGFGAYRPVSSQTETNPARSGAYYTSSPDGTNLAELTGSGRLMIEAVVDIGNISPFAGASVSPYYVMAEWDFTGQNSPVTFPASEFDTVLLLQPVLTRGAGAPPGTGTNSFTSTGFQNDGISVSNTDYFQITLSPKPGDTLYISNIYSVVGNPNIFTGLNVASQFAYSLDGINFTLIGNAVNGNDPTNIVSADLNDIPALQKILGGTTVTFRYYASGEGAVSDWGFISSPNRPGLQVSGRFVSSHTILTNPVIPTGADFILANCNSTVPGSIGFSSTGTFLPGNQYIVELGQIVQFSPSNYRFQDPVDIGTLTSSANSGIINFTIPDSTNGYYPYAVRIRSTSPPVYGTFSQGFAVIAPYCRTKPNDQFRSKISGNWNDLITWESGQDGVWIPATLIPDLGSPQIIISDSHVVTITTTVNVRYVEVKGTLKLLNGNGNTGSISLLGQIFSGIGMRIDTSGILQVMSNAAVYDDAISYINGHIRVFGKITIGDGVIPVAAGFDAFGYSSRVRWYDGSVFEWNSVNGIGPRADTSYFGNLGVATFRITKIPGVTLGSTANTIINGLLEINTPVTWTGTGTKTFRDGIKGSSTLTQGPGCGEFHVISSFEVIPETNNTIALLKGVIDNSVSIMLNTNGLTLSGGITFPDSANITITGQCRSIQKTELQAGAKLTLTSGSIFLLDNADLLNAGLLVGPGKVKFMGNIPSALASPGLTSAPIVLMNKQLYLSGNSNTGSVDLLLRSNIKLDNYNLNIGSGNLTGDSANFIITNDTGRLNRYVAVVPVPFYIGINDSSYTPVTITNAGTPDNIKVRVTPGVQTTVPVTTGNVNRTWFIGDTTQTGCNLSLTMQWRAIDEQADFDRVVSYISHYITCPPAINCTNGFYDSSPAEAASGTTYYSRQRSGITNFKSPAFIVSSRPFIYTFTGNGSWTVPANWTPGIVPPPTVKAGMEIIIDPIIIGECIQNGNITIQQGGKLTVQPGKKLKVTGQIIVE